MSLRLLSGPIVATLFGGLCLLLGHPFDTACTVFVTVWCALWWVLEPVPVPVTSIIPFVVFPLGGVLDEKDVHVWTLAHFVAAGWVYALRRHGTAGRT